MIWGIQGQTASKHEPKPNSEIAKGCPTPGKQQDLTEFQILQHTVTTHTYIHTHTGNKQKIRVWGSSKRIAGNCRPGSSHQDMVAMAMETPT